MPTLFLEETWKSLQATIAAAFAMDKERADRLANNPVAKLIAALPYLAGCRQPGRAALAHLGTYIIAAREGKTVFSHKKDDNYDVMARLAMGANFEGGDPAVIARGMKVLACVMIEGYARTAATDPSGTNPVKDGIWDASAMLANLRADIAAIPNPEMDALLPATAKGVFWEG